MIRVMFQSTKQFCGWFPRGTRKDLEVPCLILVHALLQDGASARTQQEVSLW